MDAERDELGVFAKYWEPGQVKTRLARSIGTVAAAELHRLFFTTLLRRMKELPVAHRICFDPVHRRLEFEQVAVDWELEPQAAGDLGDRMAAYFSSAFARGRRKVVLVGSDSPTLPREIVRLAFTQLSAHEVVIGPSTDGGYYLVGASCRVPPIFAGMPWSTSDVFAQSCARLSAAGIPFAVLEPWYDVDTDADLCNLKRALDKERDTEWSSLREAIALALSSCSVD